MSILLIITSFLLEASCPRPAPIIQDGSGTYPPKKESVWKAKEKKPPSPQPWSPHKKN